MIDYIALKASITAFNVTDLQTSYADDSTTITATGKVDDQAVSASATISLSDLNTKTDAEQAALFSDGITADFNRQYP